jgi:hypothetical protein
MAMKHWKSTILGAGCFLLAFWYYTSIVLSYDGEVRIVNYATEPVKNGEIEVCNQKFKLGVIPQGESQIIHYQVRADSSYKILVEFTSGRKLEKELGYVTSGRDFKNVLTLKDNDVSITLLPEK